MSNKFHKLTIIKNFVLETPCYMNKHLTDKNSTEHDNLSFDVIVSKQNHTVKWFINGVEIKDDNRFRQTKINEIKFGLEIYDVKLTEAGTLKCVIYNNKGEEVLQSEAQLGVKGIEDLKIYYKYSFIFISFEYQFHQTK